MSAGVSNKIIQDGLAECPICTEYFHDPSRIPRRMPCCDRWICEHCLDTYNPKHQNVCPLCRRQRQLSDRITYLPIEILIMGLRDILTTQWDVVPSCTGCSDNTSAMAMCENCNVYLCQPCLATHSKNILSRKHKIISFEDILSLQSTAVRVTQRKPQNKFMLNQRLDIIKQRINTLSGIESNVEKSRDIARGQINRCFDELIIELKQRRATLVSQVESKADSERTSITVARESREALQVRLQTKGGQSSSAPPGALLDESSEDVKYVRLGVSFSPANIQHLTDMVKAAGHVRTVGFRPKDKPVFIHETEVYNAIHIQSDDVPRVPNMDAVITEDGNIICPHLEFDSSTASVNVTVSATEITNARPDPPPPDTGCRIKAGMLALTTIPLFVRRNQPVMYQVKVRYSLKQVIKGGIAIFESSLTSSPVDADYNQHTGLDIQIGTCGTHTQHLCLNVVYNSHQLTDTPLTRNQVGVSFDLHVCILLDGDTNMMHVVDVDSVKLVHSVINANFDKPQWVVTCVETPSMADINSELVSGSKVTVTKDLLQLLSILRLHSFI